MVKGGFGAVKRPPLVARNYYFTFSTCKAPFTIRQVTVRGTKLIAVSVVWPLRLCQGSPTSNGVMAPDVGLIVISGRCVAMGSGLRAGAFYTVKRVATHLNRGANTFIYM
ncbi:hypothetical protein J6590_024986 [Homalodisca vitripennis]|nr:hypothetical protein J6590_024986 [Homalodisca vitripennis]